MKNQLKLNGRNIDEKLKTLYYNCNNSSACFSGVNALHRESKKQKIRATKQEIKHFLTKQSVYTKHKPIVKKFIRNKTIALGYDSDWQCDLCDIQKLSTYNKGYKYILTCIDVFSKFSFAEPLKTKKPEDIVVSLDHIFKSSKRKCWRLFTDAGGEFVNPTLKNYLNEHQIKHFISRNVETKAAVIERFNKNLKSRLWRYFTYTKTFNWLNVLPSIVKAINSSYNRSIKARPIDMSKEDELRVWSEQHNAKSNVKQKLNKGDYVRISKYKTVFEKGYLPNFTSEIFVIVKVLKRIPTVYVIEDLNGETVDGTFYEQELVKVPDTKNIYEIEKIVKSRHRHGIKEVLIKWKNFSNKFNEWLPESELIVN